MPACAHGSATTLHRDGHRPAAQAEESERSFWMFVESWGLRNRGEEPCWRQLQRFGGERLTAAMQKACCTRHRPSQSMPVDLSMASMTLRSARRTERSRG